MINVLLICSQGASTSMMCKKIKQEAEKKWSGDECESSSYCCC